MHIECCEELVGDLKEEWCAFLTRVRHAHPRQHPAFAAEEVANGRKLIFAIGREADAIVAVALLSLVPHPTLPGYWASAYCKSGPVCDTSDTMKVFLKELCRHPAMSKVGRIIITPYWLDDDGEEITESLQAIGWTRSETEKYRTTGIVDLTRNAEDIFAGMSKSARRETRRADRQGVVFRPAESIADARLFLDSLNRLFKARGVPLINSAGYEASFEQVYRQQEHGILILGWKDDVFLSGIMLMRSRNTVHGSQFTNEPDELRQHGNLRIAPANWFEAAKWGQSKGCTQLDLEGYQPPIKGDAKYNINKYKSEFNPVLTQRASEHMFTINRLAHYSGNAKEIARNWLGRIRSGRSG